MFEIIITDRIHKGILLKDRDLRLITMRKLSRQEVLLARAIGLRRYYLPNLTQEDERKFNEEHHKFWDQVTEPFNSNHPYWRNAVSSKMTEWEESAAYLALTLFTLTQNSKNIPSCIVIVCASIQEEEVSESWGKLYGWTVHKKPFLPLPTPFRKLYQVAKNFMLFSLRTAHLLYQRFLLRSQKIILNDSTVLIVSAFYSNALQSNLYIDTFFGEIDQYLSANGKKSDYLCIPLSKIDLQLRKRIEAQENPKIYVPQALLSWPELLLTTIKLFLRCHVFPESKFMGCNFKNLLTWNAHRFSHSHTLISEIYFIAVSKLSRMKHYERLLIKFEASAFERSCMQAFRKLRLGRIIGYCNGVLFPLNLKLGTTLKEKNLKPEPDIYICTGSLSKHLLEKYGGKSPSEVFSGCSLRAIPKLSKTARFSSSNSTVLVSLDGASSSVIILEWLMENAAHLEEYRFLIRAHPNVPLKQLLSQCLGLWPENFIVSDGSLEEDLQKCFCVLYRQTSIGLQALMNGIPAIHLNIDLPLPGNPMKGTEGTWWAVKNCEELLEALKKIPSFNQTTATLKPWEQKEIVENYFALPTPENMKVFLN